MNENSATEVVTLGETMALARATHPGPLMHASEMTLGMGGSESNFAIALRRLGSTVTWVGRIGVDSFGEYIRRELAAEQVDAAIVTDPTAPTGLMVKERRTASTQKVWYYRVGSAGSRLSPEDLPLDKIRRARVLHVTGITPALSESAAETVDRAIEVARDAGVSVVFDVNYRASLWSTDVAGEALRRLAGRADVVFASDDEAALVAGPAADAAELACRIAELGPAQVIIKLGARGCAALIDGAEHRTDAIPVEALDTVGAGDGFVAGYVSELLAGAEPSVRLDTAVRVGAFACLVPGDWEGMPRRSELGLLDSREPVTR
ncbi:sugar kinase [Mycobacterium neglectum]|uniref:sugar kinase n=1 Tax=Mycobacterium neglectum TaxID=242737 RepID=UPI000BFEF32F|nr:sugar kinase [Mycobacterium neglectum]